jgi:chromosome partitioning protein
LLQYYYNITIKGKKMKTIAFGIQKGGVGKTSLSVSVAAELGKKAKVLLLDLDPQGQASYWTISGQPNGELAEVLFGERSLADALCPTYAPGLSAVATFGIGGRLSNYADELAKKKQGCILDIAKAATALGFEFCILDLSPGLGCLERNAYIAADEVVTPITPDPLCVDSLELFMDNLKELKDDMATMNVKIAEYHRLVLNAVNHSYKLHNDIAKQIKEHARQQVFEVPSDQAFKRAAEGHCSIENCGARPETLQEIRRLSKELSNAL